MEVVRLVEIDEVVASFQSCDPWCDCGHCEAEQCKEQQE